MVSLHPLVKVLDEKAEKYSDSDNADVKKKEYIKYEL